MKGGVRVIEPMKRPVLFAAIKPNVAKVGVAGGAVHVTWRCARTGRVVGESSAAIAAAPSGAFDRTLANVKRNVIGEVVQGAARWLTTRVGGAVGRVITNATLSAAAEINERAAASVLYTTAAKEAAIASAFGEVRERFAWDDGLGAFVEKVAVTPPRR
jgi:hypothetical protein